MSPFRLDAWFPSSCSPQRVCHQLHYQQHQRGEGPGREAAAGGNELHLPESNQLPHIWKTRGDRGHNRRNTRAAPPRHSLCNVMNHPDIPERKSKHFLAEVEFVQSLFHHLCAGKMVCCVEGLQMHPVFLADGCKWRLCRQEKDVFIECSHLVLTVQIISSLLQFSVKWYLVPDCAPLTLTQF